MIKHVQTIIGAILGGWGIRFPGFVIGEGSFTPREGRSAIFKADDTRSNQSVISNVAEMYHIKEMRLAACIEQESPFIRAERAALLSI